MTYTKGSGCGLFRLASSARTAFHSRSVKRCVGAGIGLHRTIQSIRMSASAAVCKLTNVNAIYYMDTIYFKMSVVGITEMTHKLKKKNNKKPLLIKNTNDFST